MATLQFLLVLLGLMTACVQAQSNNGSKAATLRIVVLDGKSGKPVRGREVEIYTPASKSPGELVAKGVTNNDGAFSSVTRLPERIAVHVKGRYLCAERNVGTSVQRVADILDHGVVESNSCNSKMLRAAEPGTLTLFVHRESVKEFLDW